MLGDKVTLENGQEAVVVKERWRVKYRKPETLEWGMELSRWGWERFAINQAKMHRAAGYETKIMHELTVHLEVEDQDLTPQEGPR